MELLWRFSRRPATNRRRVVANTAKTLTALPVRKPTAYTTKAGTEPAKSRSTGSFEQPAAIMITTTPTSATTTASSVPVRIPSGPISFRIVEISRVGILPTYPIPLGVKDVACIRIDRIKTRALGA